MNVAVTSPKDNGHSEAISNVFREAPRFAFINFLVAVFFFCNFYDNSYNS